MTHTADDVVSRLQQGWGLRNHGTGWFLHAPVPQADRRKSHPVSEELVKALERDGFIELVILYTSIVAKLLQNVDGATRV